MSNNHATGRYAIVLVHDDGHQVVFESGISKERADEMQAILIAFITDVRVVDQLPPDAP